jgi:hypothetical protein
MKTILNSFLIGAMLLSPLLAQNNSLTRQYTPVVQSMSTALLFGLNVNEWSAFRFDRAANAWHPVPFQIDQLKDNGRYDKDSDGVADATDELIFMPEDAGDRADNSFWLENSASQQHPRIELEFTDPLATDEKGWIYLYKNVDETISVENYIDYSPGPSDKPAADTVKTDAFILGHDKNGWIDYLAFPDGRGDIIDRFKLRLAGKGFLIPAFEINEDFVEAETGADAVAYYSGPVRSFHETKAVILIEKLNLPLLPATSDFKYNYQYTSHSFQITAETDIDAGLLALFGIKTIRQSLDFNENAAGMKIYSLNNIAGLLVDGATDSYSDAVNNSSSQNWVMASGANGTVMLIVDISLMRNSRRLLFYADDLTGNDRPDGTLDTGDMKSFGDMGLMLKATGDALITDQLTVKFKGYFIDQPNLDAEFGNTIYAWEQNPLLMTVTEQAFAPTIVTEKKNISPDAFYLAPAYPNPYSSSAGGFIHFEINGRKNEVYDLVVYNVLGRRVARIKSIQFDASETRTLTWNARDFDGEPLSPGVYFYQLNSSELTQTHKLVISH